jgi:hypothetical protein
LAPTFDEIIEVLLGRPLMQSPVEQVTGGRWKTRRRHPHFRLSSLTRFPKDIYKV